MSLLFLRLFLTSLLIDSYGVRFRAALGLLPYILIFFRWYFIRSKILLKHLTTFWGIGYWWDILSNSGDTLQSCTWKFQKIIKKVFPSSSLCWLRSRHTSIGLTLKSRGLCYLCYSIIDSQVRIHHLIIEIIFEAEFYESVFKANFTTSSALQHTTLVSNLH